MTLKSHIDLWSILANHHDIHTRSFATFARRSVEGLPFFHKSLPSLGKDLERGLSGKFELSPATPFSVKHGTALPAFLYEHFIQVFDKEGYIRPFPRKIVELRSLLMTFYKFEVPFTPEMEIKAYNEFAEIDSAVKQQDFPLGLMEVRKNFLSLFPDNPEDIRPHHASGATADHVSNVGRRFVRRSIPQLNEVYDHTYFFNSKQHAINWCSVNDTETYTPLSRISLVQKDSRGPRKICIEPHEIMFIQKGIQTSLYWFTENMSPAKGYINFTDQYTNRMLAQKASFDGSLATIDLKDASDMVSWNLVRLLASPEWYKALKATRSPEAQLPTCRVPLNKYASMGSALCFPIEAFVFWSIAKTVAPEVWVYGDDIIVGNEFSNDVINALTAYGLIVNTDKTLTTGFFRESCGGEYYRGDDIGYIKCKSYAQDSFVAFCNNITTRFSQKLSDDIMSWYESTYDVVVYRESREYLSKPEPYIFYTDRLASSSAFFFRRWNRDTQVHEVLRTQAKSCPQIKKNKPLEKRFCQTDDDLLFDWLTLSQACTEPDAEKHSEQLFRDFGKRYFLDRMISDVSSNTQQRVTDTVPKFVWGTVKV